jgi:hypothetical protein
VGRSFAEASDLLSQLADLPVSAKQVERVTRRIGEERVAERDAQVAVFQALPLAEKFRAPAGVAAPELAVVMVDGGRLQILDRTGPAAAAVPAGEVPDAAAPAAPAAPAAAASWEEERVLSGHWREDKVASLLTMASAVSDTDPCPEVPASFLDVARVPELVRELNQHVKQAEDAAGAAAPAGAEAATAAGEPAYEPPALGQRQVLASRQTWPAFAPVVAAAAWALGFQQAVRKAFVADGAANNWAVRRRFFGSFVPILDFVHALSYVFAAAVAGRPFAAGWASYRQWIGWVWQGRVAEVIAALEGRQAEVGPPQEGEAETSPPHVVARTLTYLRNHQDKMRYDDYRRQGLPLTSSRMESVVKEVGRRVKGTEKFWSAEGAEAILQMRADHLSDGAPVDAFWQRRQASATGRRRYRTAA